MKSPHKARLNVVGNTLLAFATPIHQRRYPNLESFNAELRAKILALKDQSPGMQVSNVGGWHSEPNLLQIIGEPHASRLGQMFVECVKSAFDTMVDSPIPFPTSHTIEAWANVNGRGDTNASHIHAGCPWSGVYYVATDANAAGELEFADPRTSALMITHPLNPFHATNAVRVAPVPGMMVVFPSFLYHGVMPYRGEGPRISIAFNLH